MPPEIKGLIDLVTENTDKAQAISAVSSLALAVAALIFSVVSTVVALFSLFAQRKHNCLSVRPLAYIAALDFETQIAVRIWNNGIGPMIIKRVSVLPHAPSAPALIDRMPILPEGLCWTFFVSQLTGRSLSPHDSISLIELSSEEETEEFITARDSCREVLSTLTVEVEYTDVYDRSMPTTSRKLDWFGRSK